LVGALHLTEIRSDLLDAAANTLVGTDVHSKSRLAELPVNQSICHSVLCVDVSPAEYCTFWLGVKLKTLLVISLSIRVIHVPTVVAWRAVICVRARCPGHPKRCAFRSEGPASLHPASQPWVAIRNLSAVVVLLLALAYPVEASPRQALIVRHAVAPIVQHLVYGAGLPTVSNCLMPKYLRQGRLFPRGVLLELGINPGILGSVSNVTIVVVWALLHSDIRDWV
jgi:hypothetical protein